MKKNLLMVVVLIGLGSVVYAQTSAETRQDAQQFLTQGRANSVQFYAILNELRTRGVANHDAFAFNRLRTEIEHLETQITSEENRLRVTLARGVNTSAILFDRIDALITRHSNTLDELQDFIASE